MRDMMEMTWTGSSAVIKIKEELTDKIISREMGETRRCAYTTLSLDQVIKNVEGLGSINKNLM